MNIPKHAPSTPLRDDIARLLEDDYAYIQSIIRDHYGEFSLTVFYYDTPDARHVEQAVTERLRESIHAFIANAEQMHLSGTDFSDALASELTAWREH